MDRLGFQPLSDQRSLTRRRLLRRGAQLSTLAAMPGLLAACGSDDEQAAAPTTSTTAEASAVTGTIVLHTYPGWIGDKEVKWFEEEYPKAKVKQSTVATAGSAETVALISRGEGEYDLLLAGLVTGGHLQAADLLAEFDPARVPNLEHMPQIVRDAYPIGVPGDMGKVGFGFRKDLMSERPESWDDLWSLAPKYSGRVTSFKYEVDVMGAALLYQGHDVNATDQAQLEEAQQALLELKPHLLAFLSTDHAKPLVQGEAVMAIAYDYDIAAAQEENPDVVWVSPAEGMPAYLEGWAPIASSDNLDTVYAFLNHHMDPKVYANYINTIGASYLMPDAEPHIKKRIKDNPALAYDPETIETIGFEEFLGPDVAARRAKLWHQVLAA